MTSPGIELQALDSGSVAFHFEEPADAQALQRQPTIAQSDLAAQAPSVSHATLSGGSLPSAVELMPIGAPPPPSAMGAGSGASEHATITSGAPELGSKRTLTLWPDEVDADDMLEAPYCKSMRCAKRLVFDWLVGLHVLTGVLVIAASLVVLAASGRATIVAQVIFSDAISISRSPS